MQFRLYLLNVKELEDDNLQQKVLSLMDSFRKGKVYKYKTLKDRLHQIATGLLLQVGLLELEISEATRLEYRHKNDTEEICLDEDISGLVFLCQVKDTIGSLEKNCVSNEEISVPIEAQYELRAAGKPYWQQKFLEQFPTKKFPYFSISHSGAYAALVISDCDIGLDIQQERETTYVGGCREFSRMEAFVKCTGDGYAKGLKKYKELENVTLEFGFSQIDILENYVIWLCYYKKEVKRGVHEEKITDN